MKLAKLKSALWILSVIASALALGACGNGDNGVAGESGELTISLTDAEGFIWCVWR